MSERMTLQQAEAAALADIKAGHAVSYCTSHTAAAGCQIHLQTDQGWNPEPYWTERSAEPRPGGADDSLEF